MRHVSDEYFASDKIDEKVSKLILDLYRTLFTKTEQLSVNPYNLIVAIVKNSSKIPNIFL